MTEIKPKRRWFTFSLRALLVVVTVLCVWLGIKVNSARNQKQLVAKVRELGGKVKYDYEFGPDPFSPLDPPAEMDWLSKKLGVDYFHDVVSVTFGDSAEAKQPPRRPKSLRELGSVLPLIRRSSTIRNLLFSCSNIHDDDLQSLAELRNLHYLFLFETKIAGVGLKHLANAKNLELIWIYNSPISDQDLDALLQLPNLSWLQLEKTKLTDDGVKQLANIESLEYLDLCKNALSDASIEYLARLPNLGQTLLSDTGITFDGIYRLQTKRPNLFIQCNGYFSPPNSPASGAAAPTGNQK